MTGKPQPPTTLPRQPPRRPGHELTLHAIYNRAVSLYPHRTIAYRMKTGSGDYRVAHYTIKDMAARAKALAAALEQLGVESLDRVATLDWNTHWHLEAYFAIPLMGAVLHPVNIRLAPSEIAYILRQARDKIVLANTDFLPLLQKLAPSLPEVKAIIAVDAATGHPDSIAGIPVHNYEDLIKDKPARNHQWPRISEDQPAAMGYTTGTTGPPKGVYHTHRQILLHVLSAGLALSSTNPDFQVTSKDTIMHIVPMFHVYSWSLPYLASLIGMKQVYPNKLDPEALLELIDTEEVTLTAGVPTILYMLLSHPKAKHTKRLKGLKYINGGSALPRALAELAAKHGIKTIVGYGMTETAPVLTLAIPPAWTRKEDWLNQALKTGWPIPLVELKVVDENMKPVPQDGKTMGEIIARAPWITPEYYMDPAKTEEAWKGDWFHTGDIAVWHSDGSITIVDRAKDIIKSGGEWISTLKLEDAITKHPCITQAAVIGAYHPKWQERPIAIVVAANKQCKQEITTKTIREYLQHEYVEKGKLPKWWLPDKVIVVDELPKTSVGKIDKKKLRQKYYNTLTQQ